MLRHAIKDQGRGQTQMELRTNGFWVIGGSKLVASLIHTRVFCRKLWRPTESQRMAELPKEHLDASAPFTYSMNCFGPFIVRKAHKQYKRYGLIFTSLLESSPYRNARRFVNRLIHQCIKMLHQPQRSCPTTTLRPRLKLKVLENKRKNWNKSE